SGAVANAAAHDGDPLGSDEVRGQGGRLLPHCHDKTSIEVWTQCMDPENIVSDPPRIVVVNAFRSIEKPPAFEIVFLELIVAGRAIRRGLRNADIAQYVELSGVTAVFTSRSHAAI